LSPAAHQRGQPEAELLEEVSRLIALQAVDRELQELQTSLSSVSGRVEQLRAETEQSHAELTRLTEEDKQSQLARKQLERELAEGEARLRNKRMRLNLVRNDKELQAIGHEVEALRENNQRLEAELLVAMEGSEPRGPRIKELQETLDARRAELKSGEKEIAGQVEELSAALRRKKAERDKLAAEVNPTLLQRYDVIFDRRGGSAVVEVRKGTCMGCRRQIPPQLYNEIQKRLQIHFCPNCQRVLYWDPESA
jgi:uncharacterized protein